MHRETRILIRPLLEEIIAYLNSASGMAYWIFGKRFN